MLFLLVRIYILTIYKIIRIIKYKQITNNEELVTYGITLRRIRRVFFPFFIRTYLLMKSTFRRITRTTF